MYRTGFMFGFVQSLMIWCVCCDNKGHRVTRHQEPVYSRHLCTADRPVFDGRALLVVSPPLFFVDQDPIDLGDGRTAVEVAAGGNHTCALLDNDDVKCWGDNDYGELGQGDTIARGIAPNQMGDNLAPISLPAGWTLHSISLGYYHSCALVSEVGSVDNIVCWGANFAGQVGFVCCRFFYFFISVVVSFWFVCFVCFVSFC